MHLQTATEMNIQMHIHGMVYIHITLILLRGPKSNVVEMSKVITKLFFFLNTISSQKTRTSWKNG